MPVKQMTGTEREENAGSRGEPHRKGTLYGVGVGPGDPELMTLKAVRLIRENEVIALPGEIPEKTAAYRIAVQAVPELAEKKLIPILFPMTMDRAEQQKEHERGAEKLKRLLDTGRNVVFLTLGDPSIYSTFSYVQQLVEADGYPAEMVSGVPSFCAAAAALDTPLAAWTEPLHVIPAAHRLREPLDQPGTYVLMKSGSRMKEVKDLLRKTGHTAKMVQNCGMPGEKKYQSLEEIPDDAGYFSLILARRGN